jgi:hypothetical protein
MRKSQTILIICSIILLLVVVVEIGYYIFLVKERQRRVVGSEIVQSKIYVRDQLLKKANLETTLYALGYISQSKNSAVVSSQLTTNVEGTISLVEIASGTKMNYKSNDLDLYVSYKIRFVIQNSLTKEIINTYYKDSEVKYIVAKQGGENGPLIELNSFKVGDIISLRETYDLKNGQTKEVLIIKKNK